MKFQIAHICINSRDLVATETFYCGLLGLEKAFSFERKGELFGFYIKMENNTFIEFFKGEPGSEGNIRHVAIEVDDIDSLIKRFNEAGVAIGDKKLGADQTWQVWAEDPSGVKIEFQQYTDKSCQRIGGICKVDW